MTSIKCPLCGSPCILKIVATDDEDWCEVDICKMCLTMYPREGLVLRKESTKKAKPRKKTSKKTAKKMVKKK